MKVIISPAKKMRSDTDFLEPNAMSQLLFKTKRLEEYLKSLSLEELKKLLCCSDRIAKECYQQFMDLDLFHNPSPALFSYVGIQYQYMAPQLFTSAQLEYTREHLRILSGFYGLLRPFDGVVPYRLEMQAKCKTDFCKNLYDFWKDDLYRLLTNEDDTIINLASAEYSRAVTPFLDKTTRFITAVFGEAEAGKIVEKGVYVKMARGEMVRWLAEKRVEEPQEIKSFDRLGYHFSNMLSNETKYVFVREENWNRK